MGQGLHAFDKSLPKANVWLRQIMDELGTAERDALRALTAVLHTLRDRLPLGNNAQLAAQLPRLIRGLYFERWHPGEGPLKLRRPEEFLEAVREAAPELQLDPQEAVRAVFRVLVAHVSPGEVDALLTVLPDALRSWWPTERLPGADTAQRVRARTVRSFMFAEVPRVTPADLVESALLEMSLAGTRHVLVAAVEGRTGSIAIDDVLGMVSMRDLIDLLDASEESLAPSKVAVRDVMTPAPLETIGANAPIGEAVRRMRGSKVHALPVIEDREVVGLVTGDDLLAAAGALLH